MDRRQFLATSLAVGAAAALAGAQETVPAPQRQFKLKYAPHFGMFEASAGKDLVDQLRFMHDQGFTAMEDNGMGGRSVEDQERVAREMTRLGMTMGVFVAQADFANVTFASNAPEVRDKIAQDMRHAVEVAKRVNAKWCTVVPGHIDLRAEWDYQTANVIDNLKRAAEICEPSGLVIVIEPLNQWVDCPGIFLTKIPQAYMICRAVGSPSCKILFDMYHQQMMEGNIIPNMDRAWEEVAYFQVGDNPGRNEPTTGEMNYRNIFRHIRDKDYTGLLGMEHGNSKPGPEGERAVIDAYAQCDDF
ncbi:MAG: TIM barrel protein [FCB group bacterium]|jgi:hydroxypyruvate isomerase|nr:TIM barrel protein [FCB group bacterium]